MSTAEERECLAPSTSSAAAMNQSNDADHGQIGIATSSNHLHNHNHTPIISDSPSLGEFFQRGKSYLKSRKENSPRSFSSRRVRNRLISKNGICNISLINVPKQGRQKYFKDSFTTLIEMRWRWCLLIFCLSFAISWSLFTLLYYTIVLYHGDFEHADDPSWKPCIANGGSLLNVFVFAFTTQSTIGYGFRYPTDACPLLLITLCVQFMVGLISQTLMAGVIFAKLARPKKRAATILFSKHACISQRDGKLCLLFRVGDMRKSSLAEAHLRLQMIKRCVTAEGEVLPFHQFDMNVGYDSGLDRVFVMWPITVCHEIDASSPLYDVSKESLKNARFEIIAILEGVVESVGSTTQARTSYLPNEVLWGKRFERLVTYQRSDGDYRINFGQFHSVYDVPCPAESAKELDQQAAGTRRGSSIVPAQPPSSTTNDFLSAPMPYKYPTHSSDDSDIMGTESIAGLRNRLSINSHSLAKNASAIRMESSDEDREMDRERGALFVKLPESPHSEQQRKTSFQVRRGPDLF